MKFKNGDFHWDLLWSLDLHHNRTDLKPILHNDILSFYIVSKKLFHISRGNLILDTFGVFAYFNVNFSLTDLNESLVHMKIFWIFFHFFFVYML
jgi:hypothetical protein